MDECVGEVARLRRQLICEIFRFMGGLIFRLGGGIRFPFCWNWVVGLLCLIVRFFHFLLCLRKVFSGFWL